MPGPSASRMAPGPVSAPGSVSLCAASVPRRLAVCHDSSSLGPCFSHPCKKRGEERARDGSLSSSCCKDHRTVPGARWLSQARGTAVTGSARSRGFPGLGMEEAETGAPGCVVTSGPLLCMPGRQRPQRTDRRAACKPYHAPAARGWTASWGRGTGTPSSGEAAPGSALSARHLLGLLSGHRRDSSRELEREVFWPQ